MIRDVHSFMSPSFHAPSAFVFTLTDNTMFHCGIFLSGVALTFNRDHMLADLVLEGQVIDALDQVVYCINVRVDGLEPMDLGSDGC